MLDPREKARRDKEKELAADLNNAADLFGSVALGGAFLLLYVSPDFTHSRLTQNPPL